MNPIPDAQLTCVSNFPIATYSGMLPGVLADLYPTERMQIDLVRLCASVGARLIVDEVTGIDVDRRRLRLAQRPDLPYDQLAIGVGSVPNRDRDSIDDTVLEIKPMQTLLERFDARVNEVIEDPQVSTLRIAIVGGGVGGVEVALCLPTRLKRIARGKPFELTLVTASDRVAAGTCPRTQELIKLELQHHRIQLLQGEKVLRVHERSVVMEGGATLESDIVLWATHATAPGVLSRFDLAKDDRGFLLTRPTLQSTSNDRIFAVGDSGTIEDATLPKAGVYAVRQGPILWQNLGRQIRGEPLVDYYPQKDFLKLINLGNGRAIAEYKGYTTRGKLAWWLKDRIDGQFMDKYQEYTPMTMPAPPSSDAPMSMRCAGCGGKVSGSVLSRALSRLEIPGNDQVVLGLESPDDAAIVRPLDGEALTVTADFFKAPLDDPYLSGRIAALNSASDIFAMGAQPVAALALASLPLGDPRQQEQLLYEMLAGSLFEFRKMGATLVGGHTIEGSETTIGFTMLANQGQGKPRTKALLRAGDILVLTKPLGTGVLLAAHMQADCQSNWMDPLIKSMLLSNQAAAALLDEFDIAALTDITGFGLAGHLLEMLDASHVACELNLDQIPLLPGVQSLVQKGVESTLAPANRMSESMILVDEKHRSSSAYQVIFDPQTSGGLLLGVAESRVEQLIDRLNGQSDVGSAVIGIVEPRNNDSHPIRVVAR